MKTKIASLTFLLITGNAYSQSLETGTTEQASGSGDIAITLFIIAFITTAIMVLLAALALLRAVKVIAHELTHPSPYIDPKLIPVENINNVPAKPGFWASVMGLRPISEEKDIMLDHEFDGIVELDNPTPAWFMWLFYGSIAFAFSYLMYFHVLDYGKLQDEEYEIEMAAAKIEKEKYLASSANNIDENSVKETQDASVISAGQSLYNANCVACHGDKGQGVVGPNLTDEYWLHGGTVNSIFKTIKYGIPEKGMISWEKTLTPKQISDLSNFILSLKGSNPANGKEPQGTVEN